MADTQFGFFSTPLLLARFGWSWTKDRFERETEHFDNAIAAANRLDPAFVVVCGDLVAGMLFCAVWAGEWYGHGYKTSGGVLSRTDDHCGSVRWASFDSDSGVGQLPNRQGDELPWCGQAPHREGGPRRRERMP
jgi:hypothetical protein